mgnify:CR=1 FL=1|tara:strand:- start:426 stop:1079 length:654 start_codon:yes stop_codon:yes gene_type:complete
MRYEKKFPFKAKDLELILSNLKSYGFVEEYPKRQVNSIYYDTNEFYLFSISQDGISNREKKRIRWYNGDDLLILENKIKYAELGEKVTNKNFLKENKLIDINILDSYKNSIKIHQIPIKLDKIYIPKVGVKYQRKYLVSLCKKTRITLDYKIMFGRVLRGSKNLKIINWQPAEESVLEIKFDKNVKNMHLQMWELINKFDLQLTRFSKYCQAVLYCY